MAEKVKPVGVYEVHEIDLGIARTDERIEVSGTFINILSVGSAEVYIKLNSIASDKIDCRLVGTITADFDSIYLTNPTYSGALLKLLIGRKAAVVSAVSSVYIKPSTVLRNGKVTVSIAGTAVQLATSGAIAKVVVKALSTNTGLIYVGKSDVTSANGYQLSAGEPVTVETSNLNNVYIDADVNGEGVTYIAFW